MNIIWFQSLDVWITSSIMMRDFEIFHRAQCLFWSRKGFYDIHFTCSRVILAWGKWWRRNATNCQCMYSKIACLIRTVRSICITSHVSTRIRRVQSPEQNYPSEISTTKPQPQNKSARQYNRTEQNRVVKTIIVIQDQGSFQSPECQHGPPSMFQLWHDIDERLITIV
jgi:hypothetical protein